MANLAYQYAGINGIDVHVVLLEQWSIWHSSMLVQMVLIYM